MYRRLILLILAVLAPYLVFAATITVKLDGSGDYSVIQAALDVANPGDTVLVYPGRYYENLTMQTNNVILMSLEGTTGNPAYIDSTVIDGCNLDRCVRIMQSSIVVRGFSITQGLSNGAGGGISISQASAVINCKIYDNTASAGGGVNIIGAEASLSGVHIYNNYAVQLGGGMYATYTTGYAYSVTFDPINLCSIYNNRAGSGQDIFIQHATSDLNVPLHTFSVAEPTSYYAIYLSASPISANYNISFDILYTHHQEIENDIYVSTDGDDSNDGFSPETAMKTIHEAIYRIAADSLNMRTVHIMPGSYSRTDNQQTFPIALKSWVKVQGSGIDTTTVIGEPHPNIPHGYGSADFIFVSYMEPVISILDMSVTSRYSNNSNAILIYKSGSLNLANVRIHDVMVDYVPAILGAMSSVHDSIWENVTVENIVSSLSGLVSMYVSDSPTGEMTAMSGRLTNCTFQNAISTYVSSSVWSPSLVSFHADKRLEFVNCTFSNLTMFDDNSRAIQIGSVQFPQQQNIYTFSNCLISNNSSQGGVMLVGSSNNPRLDFINCTFAGNQGDAYTLMVNGEVNIVNSIFDNDTPYQIKVNPMDYMMAEQTNLTIDHSLIKDGVDGIQPFPVPGNTINFLSSSFSGNPLFAGGFNIHDPLYYSLSAGSPCIDMGTPHIIELALPPYDLAGNWRVWNDRIDIGCYEFGSVPWVSIDDPVVPSIPEISLLAYPNPFSIVTTIKIKSLPHGSESLDMASIRIYNLKGQLVKSIPLDPSRADEQLLQWDGRNVDGNYCANGIYFLKLQINGNNRGNKKITMIK